MNKGVIKVILFSILTLFIFWLPFLIKINSFWGIHFDKSGMDVIVRNFDGLNFLIVEKSWYDPSKIQKINQEFLTGNDPVYFSAHYPMFAVLIGIFNWFLSSPNSLIAAIITSNILLSFGLYSFFFEVTKKHKLSVLMSALSLVFPARMMAVRSVGSTEPLFMFFTLMSITYLLRERKLASSIFGSMAVLTRSPGILLFLGYVLSELMKMKSLKSFISKILPFMLMPITLILLWLFYGFQYGDFFAYFNSGDNIHLFFPPFQVFSNMQSWTSGMWLEDVIYLYVFYGFGAYGLYKNIESNKRFRIIFAVTAIYFAIIPFIAHRDISRYSLPIAPFVLLGYVNHMGNYKLIKYLIFFITLPAIIWGWNFVLSNVQPINDWSVLI